ncbi:hypothetical protein NHX12_005307 [Muraenolepis orangiensis]|uniref:Prepronociceptin n=1 Tax=Muraenolepis orangiensis TaxID=630683 RepID=A0A9Q0DP44_9TELE|nr:hypothetical protein NHX12_005307 [Muraenolepis orangiensis]
MWVEEERNGSHGALGRRGVVVMWVEEERNGSHGALGRRGVVVMWVEEERGGSHVGRGGEECGTMKMLVVAVLLLCLTVRGHCDCRAVCLSCRHLLDNKLHFNAIMCLMECESRISPSTTWDSCRQAVTLLPFSSLSIGGDIIKRAQEEVEALLPPVEGEEEDGEEREERQSTGLEAEEGLLSSMTLQRFGDASQALGLNQLSSVDITHNSLVEEEEAAREQGQAGLSISKRFGGFLKGRHGYRKLVSPGRSYQKRYGGFIGVRKSARKWNNQKRFSEFLKQYLSMSTRATNYNSVSEELTQKNEV